MTIDRASLDDVEALTEIYAACFDAPWSLATLRNFVETADVFVAQNPIEGFIITRLSADEAEIITLAVSPASRGRGLGQELMAQAMSYLHKQGCRHMFLEVAIDNAPARALYAKKGFQIAGRRNGYYKRNQGPPVDALIMTRAFDIVANS